jgi:ribonuclease-3
LRRKIYLITGINPFRISIYREALRHSSAADAALSDNLFAPRTLDNERLEFLGDAILDSVVAELLFNRFPYKDEGFLTEMRTRIVNREQMGMLAHRLGLVDVMEMKPELKKNYTALRTIGGNALEALIGAIYLDKGYSSVSKFIHKRLVGQYLDIDKLMLTTVSYKAVFMKWIQKNQKKLEWNNGLSMTSNGSPKLIKAAKKQKNFVAKKHVES